MNNESIIPPYCEITSIENIHKAWKGFIKNKKNSKDVAEFKIHLIAYIMDLHLDLKSKSYTHSTYHHFKLCDPKPRDIHKASVKDRIVHHLLYNALYTHFDKKFIYDSYSCRINKGTHKAIIRFEHFHRKVSCNYTKQCYILKCDIRKFFATIDHEILKVILAKQIEDKDILNLLGKIIDSFNTTVAIHPLDKGEDPRLWPRCGWIDCAR